MLFVKGGGPTVWAISPAGTCASSGGDGTSPCRADNLIARAIAGELRVCVLVFVVAATMAAKAADLDLNTRVASEFVPRSAVQISWMVAGISRRAATQLLACPPRMLSRLMAQG